VVLPFDYYQKWLITLRLMRI
jgi:hypothetical protein